VKRPHFLADIIDCATMDARPPVRLPPPVDEDVGATVVVFRRPRCTVCRTAEAHEGGAIHGDPAYITCGAPECRHTADLRRKAENPHSVDGGITGILAKGRRRR
jgi:hypothetical protein